MAALHFPFKVLIQGTELPLDGLAALIPPIGFTATRIGGLMLGLPLVGFEIAPARIRGLGVVVLSLVFGFSVPTTVMPTSIAGAMAGELMLGLMLGLVVRMVLASVEMAGTLIGMHAGFNFANTIDPLMKEHSNPLSVIMTSLAGLLLFISGGYHDILRALGASLRVLPPGTLEFQPGWTHFLLERANELFINGLRLALPIVLVIFATHIAFALLSRVGQQLNLWAIGFIFTIGAGILALAVFSDTLFAEINHLLDQGLRDLAQILTE